MPAREGAGDEAGCELCGRTGLAVNRHHLVPRQRGGRPEHVVQLCLTCHKQIHALFDNATLQRELNTIAKLAAEPRLRRYLDWVRRRPRQFRVRRGR